MYEHYDRYKRLQGNVENYIKGMLKAVVDF